MAQGVEHMPSKCKALTSTPSTNKKKRKKEREKERNALSFLYSIA
jgi:hypothetical protein